MTVLSYLLVGGENDLGKQTTTQARKGQLQVAIKRDGEQNPTQVYSEWVANRLAQFLGLPVALGVIARDMEDATFSRFASLWVADHDLGVFDFTEADFLGEEGTPAPEGAYNETGRYWQFKRLCERFPMEAAQLAVFDLWIGNEDRDLNLKGKIDEGDTSIMFALDQGNSLLSCGLNMANSLLKLQEPDFPTIHPMMGGMLGAFACGEMVERICAIPDWALLSAIVCGVQIGSVLPDSQYELLNVLDKRRKLLRELVQRVLLTPVSG